MYPSLVASPPITAPATDLDRWFDSSAGGCTAHSSALECSTYLVGRYLSGDYTGALFDPFGHEPANRITRSDLLAVRSLSMWRFGLPTFLRDLGFALDADAAASAVCTVTACATHIGCLLLQLPVSSTIYTMTPAEHALADGPLWNVLQAMFKRSVKKAGTTSLSKTLARKRPALLPILDDIARERIRLAGGPGPDGNWAFLRNEIAASALVRPGVAAIRVDVAVPDHYQDLRLIDIVVWMRQYVRGRLSVDKGTCAPL